jgi:YD repeat-containing protein
VWEEFYTEAYAIDSGSNRLASVTRTKGGTSTTPLRTRAFAYDGRGNIKTDTRQKNGAVPQIYPLNYGHSDRLESIGSP